MPDDGVDVRLVGRQLAFMVHAGAAAAPSTGSPAPSPGDPDEDGGIARITLRLPESVKAKAEEFAARSGHSLNTWLVNVVRAATREGAVNVDIDLSSIPFLTGDPFGGGKRGERRMTGWL